MGAVGLTLFFEKMGERRAKAKGGFEDGRRIRGIFVFGDANSLLMSKQGKQFGVSWRQLWRGDAFGWRIAARSGREKGVWAEVIAGAIVRIGRLVSTVNCVWQVPALAIRPGGSTRESTGSGGPLNTRSPQAMFKRC